MAAVRYALPQPYEEIPHTADVGLAVRGSSPAEALSRLVLALGALLADGGEVPEAREEVLRASGGTDLAQTAVAALREVLFRFATRREIPCACEVRSFSPGEAELRLGVGLYDPVRHAEGVDVKAVTYHAARFEQDHSGWRAEVVLDI